MSPLSRRRKSKPVNTCNDDPARRDRALTIANANSTEIDPDLAMIVDRWPMLSASAKAALIAMVNATVGNERDQRNERR